MAVATNSAVFLKPIQRHSDGFFMNISVVSLQNISPNIGCLSPPFSRMLKTVNHDIRDARHFFAAGSLVAAVSAFSTSG